MSEIDSKSTAKDPKPSSERVQQLANRVLMGDIVLPEFQRPFVWNRAQVLSLLDSVYRNYPIGSMLVWESRQELASKRSIADLTVGERSEQYPVNYLLDGQQRLSTICGALHWKPGNPKSVWNVVFDLRQEKFLHSRAGDDLPLTQIPVRRLSTPSVFYKSLTPLEDEELRSRADKLFNRFTDYQVPLVTLGDMTIHDVAPIFERINSTGTQLTLYDLMRAATWSPDFDLGKTIDDIRSPLSPKLFSSFDEKTFLRALAAAGVGDFSKESIDNLRGLSSDDLSAAAASTKEAAKLAADFLATEIGAPRSEALPYANQFAVLCEVFRLVPQPNSIQHNAILRWFWATTLTTYFGGWDNGQMASDAKNIRQWAAGQRETFIPPGVTPSDQIWSQKQFRSNSAVSKMAALMLAHAGPLDLLNGQKIDTGKSLAWSNDKEYHHFFPQAYLKSKNIEGSRINAIANIVLLTSTSNIAISSRRPSDYLSELVDQVGRPALEARLATLLVSTEALDAALADDFDTFLRERAQTLQSRALELVDAPETSEIEHLEATEDAIAVIDDESLDSAD